MNNDDIAHYWANQIQSSGKTGNGAFSFNGGKLFSYAKLIGLILPNQNITLLWSGSYSITTSRHQSLARQAINGSYIIVPCLGSEVYNKKRGGVYFELSKADHNENLKYFKDEIKDSVLKASRATKNASYLMQNVLALIDTYNEYLKVFKIKRVELHIENFNAEKMLENSKKQALKAKKAKAKKDREYLIEQQGRINKWINGDQAIRSLSYQLPCYLRINKEDETIETSHGANIPLSFTKILWRKIQQVIKSKKDYTPELSHSFKVGYYKLDKIFKNGNIKIGCHNIGYSELKRISLLLEY